MRCILQYGGEAGLCHRQQHHRAGGRAVTATVQRLHQFFGRVRIGLYIHVVHAVVHAVVVHYAMAHGAMVDCLTNAAGISIQMACKHAGLRHALNGQRKQHKPHEKNSNHVCHKQQHTTSIKTGQAGESSEDYPCWKLRPALSCSQQSRQRPWQPETGSSRPVPIRSNLLWKDRTRG